MKLFSGIAASAVALVTLSAVAAVAGPPASPAASPAAGKKAPAAPATLKCPACGMPMPSKKTASTPVPVVIKGHTYYCCAGCPAGKAALKKAASAKKPA